MSTTYRFEAMQRGGGDVAPLHQAALELAGDGRRLLPLHAPDPDRSCTCGHADCSRAGKHPIGGNGLRHASDDQAQVRAWLDRWPWMNLGLRTDDLTVIDVDGAAGARSLEQLQAELGELPPTWSQSTGRGSHLIFAGEVAGNSTAPLGNPAGIDLRSGRHGYIVNAPSWHLSGCRYERYGPAEPAPLPRAWRERLNAGAERPLPAAAAPSCEASTAYGRAALAGELERLLRAREGERNNELNRAVFRLGQLAAGGELAQAELEATITAYALRIGLDPLEVSATVCSALRAGLRYPRRRR